jgi:hypothetical protein
VSLAFTRLAVALKAGANGTVNYAEGPAGGSDGRAVWRVLSSNRSSQMGPVHYGFVGTAICSALILGPVVAVS